MAAPTSMCTLTEVPVAASSAPSSRPPATAPMLHTACNRLTIGIRACASTATASTFIETSETPSARPARNRATTNHPSV